MTFSFMLQLKWFQLFHLQYHYNQLLSDIIKNIKAKQRARERHKSCTDPMGGVTPRPLASKCLRTISESSLSTSGALWTDLEVVINIDDIITIISTDIFTISLFSPLAISSKSPLQTTRTECEDLWPTLLQQQKLKSVLYILLYSHFAPSTLIQTRSQDLSFHHFLD